ncbi:MAG: SAF domain-containing protein [Actinomycetota bacterium]
MTQTVLAHASTQSEQRQANRIRRPSFTDIRLLGGVLLVVGSVVGGYAMVNGFDQRVEKWRLVRSMAPGETLTPDDVRKVRVELGDQANQYVSSDSPVTGMTMVRGVDPGELLPKGSVSTVGSGEYRILPTPITTGGQYVQVGDLVEVWVAKRDGARDAYAPSKSLTRATVVELPPSDRSLGAGGDWVVTLSVPQASVEELITAVDNQSRITVVVQPTVAKDPRG